ncbi:MAG: hypothetical protein AAGI11_18270 [Pseudomonadota bacterium]
MPRPGEKPHRGRRGRASATSKVVTVRLSAEDYAELEDLAEEQSAASGRRTSVSDAVRAAIQRELDKRRK